ncbi:hypothetical protein BS78_K099500 [Paspalum vaginatum]|uniref:Uncharacterized protein n=1 Tax=Paspalum vaginatum TaxID=158149 RepID=A0A9W7X8F8_9POAL|nr:hypothetical protein BS78_K099500 [Paspalum vaginatum]
MGGFCCCLSTEDFEEYVHPNNPIYRQCISLRHFFHNVFGGYTATFQRLESRPSNLSQGVAPLGSTNPSANIMTILLLKLISLFLGHPHMILILDMPVF